jgi:hemerythrin
LKPCQQDAAGFGIASSIHRSGNGFMATLFNWTESLRVGNDFIDSDHKKLIKMVNDFHNAMQEGRGNEVIGKVLNNLIIYTREHFAREEAEMKRIGYSKSLAHQLEHTKLLNEVTALQNSFNSGQAMLTMKVSAFLKTWLIDHIEKTDKQFASAIAQFNPVKQ